MFGVCDKTFVTCGCLSRSGNGAHMQTFINFPFTCWLSINVPASQNLKFEPLLNAWHHWLLTSLVLDETTTFRPNIRIIVVDYFTTVSVPQRVRRGVVKWVMNGKGFDGKRLLFNCSTLTECARRTKRRARNATIRKACVPDQIRSRFLPNRSPERRPHIHVTWLDARWLHVIWCNTLQSFLLWLKYPATEPPEFKARVFRHILPLRKFFCWFFYRDLLHTEYIQCVQG